MSKFKVTAKLDTYAECIVEAKDTDGAYYGADQGDPTWTYETDFDSSRITKIERIEE